MHSIIIYSWSEIAPRLTRVFLSFVSVRREEADDDLSELQSDAVPDEVRKWLASTFAKQEETVTREGERPSFRSVANAIRTGIFIDKIYRGMSHGTQMEIPAEIQAKLKVNEWSAE